MLPNQTEPIHKASLNKVGWIEGATKGRKYDLRPSRGGYSQAFPPFIVTEKFLELPKKNWSLLKIPRPLERASWGWYQIQRAQTLVNFSCEASEIGSGAQKENTKPRRTDT